MFLHGKRSGHKTRARSIVGDRIALFICDGCLVSGRVDRDIDEGVACLKDFDYGKRVQVDDSNVVIRSAVLSVVVCVDFVGDHGYAEPGIHGN